MKYTVILNNWVNGSGWRNQEAFDSLDELCTAEEYIRSLDEPLTPVVGVDDILVEIHDEDDNKLSECWVSAVD